MDDARTQLLQEWNELSQQVADVMASRGKNYGGDPEAGFGNIGLLWTGILQDFYQIKLSEPVPPHLVSLMMSALKLSRSARPHNYNPDDLLDAIAYSFLADSIQKRENST